MADTAVDPSALREITLEMATSLAEQEGDLRLDALESLSCPAAQALARHTGGSLSLAALAVVADDVADQLATHQGPVYLRGLKSLTSPALAAKLADGNTYGLSLPCLTHLSDAAAEAVASTQSALSLDGLTVVSDAAIRSLATHTHGLSLNGLLSLSDEAATSLASHTGQSLSLNSVASLSEAAVATLAQYKGTLDLGGLKSLSSRQAELLASRTGVLKLDGVRRLSDQAVIALAEHRDGLSLNGLTALSTVAASALVDRANSLPSTVGWCMLPGFHKCSLALDGLTSLDQEVADVLAQLKGGPLSLNGVTELTAAAAGALASCRIKYLYLNGLTTLSADVASALSGFRGILVLNGVKTLSPEAAEKLAGSKGMKVSMAGLVELSDAAAFALARHKSHFVLPELTAVSEEGAAALRACRCELPEKLRSGPAAAGIPRPDNTLRIFLSSTFRDFSKERDLLAREVLPNLREEWCKSRNVDLIDVDLRWGITQEEAEQGGVLPICLAEIERARPFFIGLIGERYGWVPPPTHYPEELLADQPWLREHVGVASITELEILHGVLNNPAMIGRALFYFRDSQLSLAEGSDCVTISEDERKKLIALKDRILASGFDVWSYRSLDDLSTQIDEDLTELIIAMFPEVYDSDIDDRLALSRQEHKSHGDPFRAFRVGTERYIKEIDDALQSGGPRAVLITGPRGCGKTTALCHWADQAQLLAPQTIVILHHLDMDAKAADPARLELRLVEELADATGHAFSEGDIADGDHLPDWLQRAGEWAEASGRRIVLVLDDVDKHPDLFASHRQRDVPGSEARGIMAAAEPSPWWPRILPQGVCIVATCKPGGSSEKVREALAWTEIKIESLSPDDRAAFVEGYLGRFRKRLTPTQSRAITGHPLSGNSSFLCTILEELRTYGSHEDLDTWLETLLSNDPHAANDQSGLGQYYEYALERLESELGEDRVRQVFLTLAIGRGNLSEGALLSIADVPALTWASIMNRLGGALRLHGGCVLPEILQEVVEKRYPLPGDERLAIHQRIAAHLETLKHTPLIACETAVHLRASGQRQKLVRWLCQRDVFEALWMNNRTELLEYFVWLGEEADIAFATVVEAWGRAAREPPMLAGVSGPRSTHPQALSHAQAIVRERIGAFLKRLSYRSREFIKLRYGLADGYSYTPEEVAHIFKTTEQVVLQEEARVLADLKKGHVFCFLYDVPAFIEQLAERTGTTGRTRLQVARLFANRDNRKCIDHARGAMLAFEATLGREHALTSVSVAYLAGALCRDGKGAAALPFAGRAARGLECAEEMFGPDHVQTLEVAESVAVLMKSLCEMRLGRPAKEGSKESDQEVRAQQAATAELLLARVHSVREASLGSLHRDTARVAEDLGKLLTRRGETRGIAETLLRSAMHFKDSVFGPGHPESLATFGLVTALLAIQRKLDEFRKLHDERREILQNRVNELRSEYGDEDEATLEAVSQLAALVVTQHDFKYAKHLLSHILRCRREELGKDHADTLSSLHALGEVFHEMGQLPKAERLFRRAIAGRKRALGQWHKDTLTSAKALASVLHDQGNHADAAKWLRRVLAGYRKTMGNDDSTTREAAEFLAACESLAVDDGFFPLHAWECPDPAGTIVNSIGMKLVPIPAGTFLMGAPEDCHFADPVEEFQHRVRITKPFLLGMHQVTQSQYEKVVQNNPSFFKGPDLPVEHLTWKEAHRFCELLSALPAEVAAGRLYRLPTEAEWEYACRAATTTTFNTGDRLELHQARFATMERSSPKPTAPVGSYPPNAWGLYDMHGNVWEWTADWFSAKYFKRSPVDDPTGPKRGTHHTLRGGSASVQAHECRGSFRGEAAEDGPEDPPAARFAVLGDFGIRVVCQQIT